MSKKEIEFIIGYLKLIYEIRCHWVTLQMRVCPEELATPLGDQGDA